MKELLILLGVTAILLFFYSFQRCLSRKKVKENISLREENQILLSELKRLEATYRWKDAKRNFERISFYYRQAEEAFQLGNFDEDSFYETRKDYMKAKNYYESIKKNH